MEYDHIPSGSDYEDSDFEDDLNLYDLKDLFKLNKQRQSIKMRNTRLNWNQHVICLQITGRFNKFYHMSLPAF